MPRTRLTLVLLTSAGVSLALMQTLVIPALPYFAREFGSSPSWTAWIVTGFLLSSSILTPIVGRLGDAHGKKRVLVGSLVVFGLASLGAAAAWDLPSLVAFRFVQGVGAAVFPLAFAIIRDEFPPERVGFAIGTVSSAFGLGGGVGLVLGGLMLEHLSWQWLFVVGGVPSLVAAALIARCVPESPVRTRAKADWAGAAVLSLALVALLVALSEGAHWGWDSLPVAALAVAAAALLATLDPDRAPRRGPADRSAHAGPPRNGGDERDHVPGRLRHDGLLRRDARARAVAQGRLRRLAAGGGAAAPAVLRGDDDRRARGRRPARPRRAASPCCAAGSPPQRSPSALMAVAHEDEVLLCAWLAMLGSGAAFALAAIGALVIDHSRPSETGVAGGMNSIMRTVGGSFGGQIAAALLTAGTAGGFTQALAVTAAAAALGLAPTLLLSRAPARALAPAA